jgi:hypothetical protein
MICNVHRKQLLGFCAILFKYYYGGELHLTPSTSIRMRLWKTNEGLISLLSSEDLAPLRLDQRASIKSEIRAPHKRRK